MKPKQRKKIMRIITIIFAGLMIISMLAWTALPLFY